jgi:magnesium transporter
MDLEKKSLHYLNLLNPFATVRTKEILHVNPTIIPQRLESNNIQIDVYEFNGETLEQHSFSEAIKCPDFQDNNTIKWINVDGINKATVETLCKQFNIHYLLAEDIQSVGSRPKMDEIDNHLFCLLHMLYFNKETSAVESEQISFVLGSHYVISFQEDAERDVFNALREKLKVASTKLRQSSADYFCYALIDMIVDNYFFVMEQLGDKIENLEEEIIHKPTTKSLSKVNQLRKEIIVLKRSISPVRELINGLIKTDSDLINENTNKYFKDIYDHVMQASDLVENYRDVMINMQDLYINQVNLKMNEVMKVMTIVTCLLAPATVIGGIFGMNFETIPYLHNRYGFFLAVGIMLLIPILMLRVFRKRGWF